MRVFMKKTAAVAVVGMLIVMGLFSAGARAETTKILALTGDDLTSADAEELILTFAVADKVAITRTADANFVVMAVVEYNEESGCEPSLVMTSADGVLTATFAARDNCSSEIDISQQWEITLGDCEPDTDITIRGDVLEGEIDLGGLPLRNLLISTPQSELDVDFSSPTKRSVASIDIHTTGCRKLTMSNIGNTDFETFELFAGGMNVDLDFRGAYGSNRHGVKIEGAANRFNIIVPADASQTVQSLITISSVSVGPLLQWNKRKRVNNAFIYSSSYEYENTITIDLATVYSSTRIFRK